MPNVFWSFVNIAPGHPEDYHEEQQKSPAVIRSLLQLVFNADIIAENSFINAFILSLLVLGGLYIMFPTVTLLDRLPPFIWIINTSQCS